jgi:hypothetical protein
MACDSNQSCRDSEWTSLCRCIEGWPSAAGAYTLRKTYFATGGEAPRHNFHRLGLPRMAIHRAQTLVRWHNARGGSQCFGTREAQSAPAAPRPPKLWLTAGGDSRRRSGDCSNCTGSGLREVRQPYVDVGAAGMRNLAPRVRWSWAPSAANREDVRVTYLMEYAAYRPLKTGSSRQGRHGRAFVATGII